MSARRAAGTGRAAAAMRAQLDSKSTGAADNVEKKGRKRGKAAATGNDTATASTADGVSPYFQAKPPKKAKQAEQLKPGERLEKSFFEQDTISLSKALLGKVLCRKLPGTGEILKGTIVETEAYPGVGDEASSTSKGVPTPASMPLFMDPGTAYVYMTYGMYHCFNISSNDTGGGCLLRAIEVHDDYEIMQKLRRPPKKATSGSKTSEAKLLKRHELANGPSKLCMSFNINKELCNKIDTSVSDDLWVENSTDDVYLKRQFEMDVSRRVGIDMTPPAARNQLYRYFVKDNTSVSKPKFKDDSASKKSKKKGRSKKAPDENETATASDDGTSPYFQTPAADAAKQKKKKQTKTSSKMGERLDKSFFEQDTITLSKELLGKVLCRKLPGTGEIVKGTIVETEAYTGVGDFATHSHKGVPTPRTLPMFMDPGTAYVYLTHGIYNCFNISSSDTGGVCLIRALDVHDDYKIMQELRRPPKKKERPSPYKNRDLANGPSKLCLSFNINKELCNKLDLTVSDDLWIENSTDPVYFERQFEMEVSKRVGIDNTPPKARDQLYRFFVKGNTSVSKARFKPIEGEGGVAKKSKRKKVQADNNGESDN